MPRGNSLTTRLLLSHFAVLLVGALGVFGPMSMLRWNPQGMMQRVLIEESQLLLDGLRSAADGRPTHIELPAESIWLYSALPGDFLYRVVDDRGQVVISSHPGGAALAPPGRTFDAELNLFEVDGGDGGTPLSVRATTIQQGGQRWTVQVAASQRLVKLTRLGIGSPYVRAAVVPLTLLLLVVSAVIVLTLRRMLRPLREASLAAGRIAPDALQVRLDQRRVPAEVLPLIEAFNQALGRLERGFALQQEFLATAAHELKTPLALIRAQLEADGCAPDSPLLADVDFMSRLAERSGVELVLLGSALFILLKNLVENALQHSAAGTRMVVDVAATELRVVDQGPGIPAADLPHLFDRFWRGSARLHSGAGLGLTICQAIAQAHGWRLQAHSQGMANGSGTGDGTGPESGAVFTLTAQGA